MGILAGSADVTRGPGRAGSMASPRDLYDTLHTITIKSRETEFGSIIEPVPITLKVYKPLPNGTNGYSFPSNGVIRSGQASAPRPAECGLSAAHTRPGKDARDTSTITRAPPKKKWIREYLEEEPAAPVSLRVVPAAARSPGAASPPASPAAAPPAAPLLDQAQEHSRPRTTSVTSHGPAPVPSPPSVGSSGSGSSGSAPRAGTREVHNKLEKNRRAHLKECFELLKRQLPATPDDKKTSNLSILGSAIRYIQVLRRKERECEHEMERLAREKIAAQQRLAALKREVSVRSVRAAPPAPLAPRAAPASALTCGPETIPDDKDMQERINGHVLGISPAGSPPRSPPHISLSSKLRALPIQITPTTSQTVVRTSYGARHNTLTLSALACADSTHPSGAAEGALSTLLHPAQIHLPISQVVSGGGLVVSPAALQLLSAGGVRVLPHNGVSADSRIPRTENGIIQPTPGVTTAEGVVPVVGRGLAPLVVSQPHLLHTHTLTHKMVERGVVKGGVAALGVGAQYLSTALVKPVVVVSSAHTT